MGSSVVIDSYSIDAGKTARNINIKNGLFKKMGSAVRLTVALLTLMKRKSCDS